MLMGIDVGGTKCAVTIADGEGAVKEKRRFDTDGDAGKAIENILTAADELARIAEEKYGGKGALRAFGVSCGGPLDEKKGLILSPPNLPGWDNVPVVGLVSERLGIPGGLRNDANACAMAEYMFGAGKGAESLVFLTFGTGLGAGIIAGGKLISGFSGNAGELGHIRLSRFGPVGYGKAGSFEGFCSGGGLRQLAESVAAEARGGGRRVAWDGTYDPKTVQEFAESGDRDAVRVYNICGAMLGRGLAIVIDMLNPERIIIGSIFARAAHLLEPEMYRVLKEEALGISLDDCRILPAGLGESIGDAAAIAVAKEKEDESYAG